MAGTLPPMLQVMKDIGGVEIPDALAKLVGESSAGRDEPVTAKSAPNGAPVATADVDDTHRGPNRS
jgi:flotillin